MLGHDHVAVGAQRKFPGGPGRSLGPHPWSIEKLNKGEGQEHQQEDHPGAQHDDGEKPPEISMEGNIAKPQRAHDGERPIEPRDPTVVLTLPLHQVVEDRTICRN